MEESTRTVQEILKMKRILGEDGIINTQNLLDKNIKSGKGSGTRDVYKIEGTELVYYYEDSTRKVLGEIANPEDQFEFDRTTGTIIKLKNRYYSSHITKDDGNGVAYSEKIVILSQIYGVDVKKIGDMAFAGFENIKEIVVREGVTEIGAYAFTKNYTIEKITLPNSLKKIGTGTFADFGELANITIPPNVTSIGSRAFDNCRSIRDVIIPKGVTKIEHASFSAFSIRTIVIPDSVKEIEGRAFQYSGITEITIPDSVTTLGSEVFAYTNLIRIYYTREYKENRMRHYSRL